MPNPIPSRESSRYAGQYSGAFDAQRIIDIFSDSYRIALSSKNPETAKDRFYLSVEAYHQLMTMRVTEEIRKAIKTQMDELAEKFPVQSILNEAEGICEKARKLKTIGKKLDLFDKAKARIKDGLLESPSNSLLIDANAKLQEEIEFTKNGI